MNKEKQSELVQRFRLVRETLHMTQSECAKMFQVDQSFLCRIEVGRKSLPDWLGERMKKMLGKED